MEISTIRYSTIQYTEFSLKTLFMVTYHLRGCFNFGGWFLGIKNNALIGCMSHSAGKRTEQKM